MIETVFKEFIDSEHLVPEKAGLRQLISDIQRENQPLVQELNTSIQTVDSTRKLVEKLILETIDESVIINTPFQTDFGRHIHFGKDIYINKDVFMVDLGGIFIEDRVLIGPRAKLISVNHPLKAEERHKLELKSVRIQENAWIGADATILPGVTIGKNAVVAAGAIVTKDVPDNTLVAGAPAKIIKTLA
ncbi:sugar O-acetyltransferase [Streptococcus suis]|uniref:Acetyltransferase n=1 Tax=Streptococcus suis TaxID=1307 RepID=A0A116QXC3_STRSU|nr:sugar O-acetyltransferase [Streptococcus suis]NQR96536.1 sugar O-acetyltransferase [Streptococcus suis]CYX36827.1 acetyltransferase [Streptococcus suis]